MMRIDTSTSGHPVNPDAGMLADTSNAAEVAPTTLAGLSMFLVVTMTATWLAFLPMIMGLVERTSAAG